MVGHHFISYSEADARDFAFKLHDALEAGPPHVSAWLDWPAPRNLIQPI
jgi:hypothetical protein